MADKFKGANFNIQENSEGQETRVVKLDMPTTPEVKQFAFDKLRKPGDGDYSRIRAKFGALAATDAGRAERARKDSRFTINPLIRDGLRVDEEERRVIEERVHERVSAVEAAARAEADRRGYDEGLARGREEAFKAFQGEAQSRMERFEKLLGELEGAKEQIYRENERFVVELSYRIARMILLREVKSDKDYVLRLAGAIIERMGVRENIRIRVSPEDLQTAAMIKEGLERELGSLKNLLIEGSPEIRGGGCEIETEWNAIDASIDTQLQAVHQALIDGKAT